MHLGVQPSRLQAPSEPFEPFEPNRMMLPSQSMNDTGHVVPCARHSYANGIGEPFLCLMLSPNNAWSVALVCTLLEWLASGAFCCLAVVCRTTCFCSGCVSFQAYGMLCFLVGVVLSSSRTPPLGDCLCLAACLSACVVYYRQPCSTGSGLFRTHVIGMAVMPLYMQGRHLCVCVCMPNCNDCCCR
jgi:hypothetical protein